VQTGRRGEGYTYRDEFRDGAVIARPARRPAKRRKPSTPRVEHVDESAKQPMIEMFGTIKQVYPSTTFGVELENGHEVLAHIAGRLRRHHIKLLLGDRVELEISPYDLTKGRIIYRYRAGEARRSSSQPA
jgi:translation initiation factor IF-1